LYWGVRDKIGWISIGEIEFGAIRTDGLIMVAEVDEDGCCDFVYEGWRV
jgi:hypothetical protein